MSGGVTSVRTGTGVGTDSGHRGDRWSRFLGSKPAASGTVQNGPLGHFSH